MASESVLRNDGYRRLYISAALVIFGVMGQAVARGWLARELTGTNAGLGGVMLVFGVAMLLATPWVVSPPTGCPSGWCCSARSLRSRCPRCSSVWP